MPNKRSAKRQRPLDKATSAPASNTAAKPALSRRQQQLLDMQRVQGNERVQRYLERDAQAQGGPELQRFINFDQIKAGVQKVIDFLTPYKMPPGRVREEAALKKMVDYAFLHGDKGPLGNDTNFSGRLIKTVFMLRKQMAEAPSFDKMASRLKAIVFSAEQLNLDPIVDKSGAPVAASPDDQAWMKTTEDTQGAANPHREGSAAKFGETAWKCNKMVADAYASTEGAEIREEFPFYPGGKWTFKANALASGKKIKHFPLSELVKVEHLKGVMVEIEEYDKDGKVVAKYVLDGGVYHKEELIKGKWVRTKETKTAAELAPGTSSAQMGDIVAFRNVDRGASGHTGLNLGNDLFISAMNATNGVGILSIADHIDPASGWDAYDQVAFRQHQ